MSEGPAASDRPLYKMALGEAWETLPEEIKAMHRVGSDGLTASGRAKVERGGGLIARIAAILFRFPMSADDVPVTVHMSAQNGVETWARQFDGRTFRSRQRQPKRREETAVVEEIFGPFAFDLKLAVDDSRLTLRPVRQRFLGVLLPKAFLPAGNTHECVVDGRFTFHVEIIVPFGGLIVRYTGWLIPE